MIKINIEKKLSNINMSIKEFEERYSEVILNETCQTVHKPNNGLCSDIFNFHRGKSEIQLRTLRNTSMSIPSIFLKLYNSNNEFKTYIDRKFRKINNITEAKELVKKIVLMHPQDLEFHCTNDHHSPALNKLIYKLFNYDTHGKFKSRSKPSLRDLISSLNFRVCIYCNRNYTTNFEDGSKNRPTFTLDHFHQKEKHPIFALSLYNLIPSCSICNTVIKGSRSLSHYKNPYSKDYNFHELSIFKIQPNYSVNLVSDNKDCRDYIRDFKISKIYECHNTEIKEFVKKRRIFNNNLIEIMAEVSKRDSKEIKSYLFGSYNDTENMGDESLSKLRIDLAKQLHIT
ncbi:TPA: hypothetical protein NJ441_004117 [Vibrio parahaemolyticus]|nr:hypothetical protein [Vibrio parahaemolyticus]